MDLDDFIADRPAIHDAGANRPPVDWGISPEALRWMHSRIEPGSRSLETGAGLSTILFAMLGTRHTAITPNRREAQRITEYCRRYGIDSSGITFIFDNSERVLPNLDAEPLDSMLIDGSHAFPITFVDFYYGAVRLKIGGVLIVDDTQLWTGRTLTDFLAAEPDWELSARQERTSIFRKVSPTNLDVSWVDQPFVAERSLVWHAGKWTTFRRDLIK